MGTTRLSSELSGESHNLSRSLLPCQLWGGWEKLGARPSTGRGREETEREGAGAGADGVAARLHLAGQETWGNTPELLTVTERVSGQTGVGA